MDTSASPEMVVAALQVTGAADAEGEKASGAQSARRRNNGRMPMVAMGIDGFICEWRILILDLLAGLGAVGRSRWHHCEAGALPASRLPAKTGRGGDAGAHAAARKAEARLL